MNKEDTGKISKNYLAQNNSKLQAGSIYIHMPFCKQACHYCDFYFSTNLKNKNEIIESIINELKIRKSYLDNAKISSIYIGGGTPSLLEPSEIAYILQKIKTHFFCIDNIEITMELNPDDVTYEQLRDFKLAGINRLSIGVQSFNDKILKYLNRSHNSKQAINIIENAQKIDFKNISIDLIYAIPILDNNMWAQDLKYAVSLNTKHISAYCLTIEKKTYFGFLQAKGALKAVSDDISIEQFKMLVNILTKHGYEHYEISSFAKKGAYSTHNMNYWNKTKYLGLGPSAHSYNATSRQWNIANNRIYIDKISKNIIPATVECLTKKNHINEYIMTSLRTQWGCDLNFLQKEYDYTLPQKTVEYIETLISKNMVLLKENKLTLTIKGKILADKIASDLFYV